MEKSDRTASRPDLGVGAIGTRHMNMGSILTAGQDIWRPDNQPAGSLKKVNLPIATELHTLTS